VIIPDPYNPADFDRYSYVRNIGNPVNFTDPTGHRSCDDEGPNGQCITSVKTPLIIIIRTKIYERYGVFLSDKKGAWSVGNEENVLNALDQLNNTLGGIDTFTSGTIYYFYYDPNHYGGLTYSNGDITFHSPVTWIPYQNIYHEVAHSIDYKSGGYFSRALGSKKVYDSEGNYVMGGSASNYQRNSKGYAELKIVDPSGLSVDAQQHPGNAPCSNQWCEEGNTPGEEWADLADNYAAGNFNNLPAGIARQEWVSNTWRSYFAPIY
jgi:hypothetical protein